MKPGSQRMDDTFARLLDRRETQGRRRRLTLPPPGSVDFSSNSYLSLAENPELRKRYIELLQSSSDQFSLGSGGSRLLDGNTAFTEELENRIASFHNAPTGLLFNSGFDANSGLFGCAPQPGDVVIYDELIHASVHDGMKLGRAKKVPFAHNRVDGDDATPAEGAPGSRQPESLSAVINRLLQGPEGESFRSGRQNIFVAVEGVYSMDGDVAPLQEIVACVRGRLPHGNGHIIVDEAHSTGIIGHRGRGLVCQLGLEDQIWARVHTFGKAMGCAGGELCSDTLCKLQSRTNTGHRSDCTLLGDNQVVSYQLCAKPHIHDRTGLPVASRHTNDIRTSRGRLCRQPAPESGSVDTPGTRQSGQALPAARDPASNSTYKPVDTRVSNISPVYNLCARVSGILPAAWVLG